MTDRIETLRSLQKRIRESKGADRELNAAIFRAFDGPLPKEFANFGITLTWQDDGTATMPIGDMQVRYDPPLLTASLDACVALMAAVLAGWTWGRDWFGNISLAELQAIKERNVHSLRLATDCHTFLDAIFSAAIAEEEAKQPEKTT